MGQDRQLHRQENGKTLCGEYRGYALYEEAGMMLKEMKPYACKKCFELQKQREE